MPSEQQIIQANVGGLELAKPLGNVSKACLLRGSRRDSFARFKAFDETGGEAVPHEIYGIVRLSRTFITSRGE